jgi:prepilin-type N-terminal cleavage/methylation domain-containing protein/prepilin-type processing-associated H-X9-DG protein
MISLPANRPKAFSLIELLVVISIIALLTSITLPSLRRARQRGYASVCANQLRTLGQGLAMYALDHNDAMPPGRLPDLGDGVHWRMEIDGGLKYRPTFLAILGSYVGVQAFDEPMSTKTAFDRSGERGDRQNYSSRVYVCPSVPHWTDERNGSYGYNYQFLGNSRLHNSSDPFSFKNWPVKMTRVKSPSRCVAIADCVGTAASFVVRGNYDDNAHDADRLGNEGFNLDPPRVDPADGEMADKPHARTAVDVRHLNKGAVLWVDAHVSTNTLKALGYQLDNTGVVTFDGLNYFFSTVGDDAAWLGP